MTMSDWRQLAITSLSDPAQAARTLMAMRIPRDALWTGLFLVAVLNTILAGLSDILIHNPTPLPAIFSVPVVYFAVVSGGLILTVYSIFWTGRMMSGKGTFEDVLVLMVWLQMLRVIVQAVTLVLFLVMPMFAALLVFAASLVGVYILVHFVNQAHQLGSIPRAAGVLIASVLLIVLGLTMLLSLVGGASMGRMP